MTKTNGKKKSVKKVAKKAVKATKKVVKKAVAKKATVKKTNQDQDSVFKLMLRNVGATLHDFIEAGYSWPAMGIVKMAERNGFKTSVKKVPGEPTRYFATAK